MLMRISINQTAIASKACVSLPEAQGGWSDLSPLTAIEIVFGLLEVLLHLWS
jgi:hypothetical protein